MSTVQEADFQNCLSEFNLDLLEQTTGVTQATPLVQCPEARELSIASLKLRLSGISNVVEKAKRMNEHMQGVRRELANSRQETEEVRQLLFESNVQHKVLCEERTAYYNELEELRSVARENKEKDKIIGDLHFHTKLNESIISGYSDQVKGLQTELESREDYHTKIHNDDASALKQSKAKIALLEKRLIKVLHLYLDPLLKNPDRWIKSLYKKYLPEELKEESSKIEKPDGSGTKPKLRRKMSSDFDCIGSVDTGRGSSLAFSDGEKSTHSPDYYKRDSPPFTVGNIGNKWNVPKSDRSTSPIWPERTDIADNSATKCVLVTRKNACTSPIPPQVFDIATDTSEIAFEILCANCAIKCERTSTKSALVTIKDTCSSPIPSLRFNEVINTSEIGSPVNNITSNTEDNNMNIGQAYKRFDKISQISHLPNETEARGCNEISSTHTGISNKETLTTRKLEDFSFDTDDEDDDIASNGSGIASPVEELNTLSPVHLARVITNNPMISSKEALAINSQDNKEIDANDGYENVQNKQKHVKEIASTIPSEKLSLSMSLQLQDDTSSVTDDNAAVNNVSPVRESHMFSPIDFDDTASKCIDIASIKLPTKQRHMSPDSIPNITKNTQELECLELNNSNNYDRDVEIDTEIRSILNKMRLHHRIMTPIPATPPRRKMPSPILPVEYQNTSFRQQACLIAENINEQMNLFREKVQELFVPFVDTFPKYLEQIPRLFSRGDLNEDLLRNLLCDPNKSYGKHLYVENTPTNPSYNTHIELNNRRQPDVVDLNTGSMLCITETSKHLDSAGCDYTIIEEEESEVDGQITSTYSSNKMPHDGTCQPVNVQNNEMSNASLLMTEKENFVAPLKIAADDVFNSSSTAHKNIAGELVDFIEYDNITQVTDVNSSTAISASTIESRNSIVYEGKDISDDDSDVLLSELDISRKNLKDTPRKLRKRKGKLKKITKLESLRLKMVPKSKIKIDDTKSVKNQCPKPNPINTFSKKKVKESDTAASLNDKSVYENAVKVIAALRTAKEPRICIKDCVIYSEDNAKKGSDKGVEKRLDEKKHNEGNKDDKSQSPTEIIKTLQNKKRKLSENLTNKAESHTFNRNESAVLNNTKKGANLNEKTSTVSPKKIKQVENNIESLKQSYSKSDAKKLSTKRTNEIVHSLDSSETKTPKRKRSVSDYQTSNRAINIMEPDSPRVLRSSQFKHNKQTGFEETPIDAHARERLRSKVDQNKPAQDNIPDYSLRRKPRIGTQKTDRTSESSVDHNTSELQDLSRDFSLRRKPRIARQKTDRTSESSVDHNTSELQDLSRDFSLRRMPRIARQKTDRISESSVDQNKPESQDLTRDFSLRRKPRIARQKTDRTSESSVDHNDKSELQDLTRDFSLRRRPRIARQKTDRSSESSVDYDKSEYQESTPDFSLRRNPRTLAMQKMNQTSSSQTLDSSIVSKISRINNNRVVSYADLNLFMDEGTKDQTVDENNDDGSETQNKTLSSGISPRKSKQKTERGPEGPQVTIHTSTPSKIHTQNNGNAVSYADLNLFSNGDTQDQTVNQSELKANNSTLNLSSGRNHRIARPQTDRGSGSIQVDLHNSTLPETPRKNHDSAAANEDINLFTNHVNTEDHIDDRYRVDSLLCTMIQKYGVQRIKTIAKQIPDRKVNEVWNKLETSLTEICEAPHDECVGAMKRLVVQIRSWDVKIFIAGFIKYLRDPERKIELFNKVNCPPCPPMTKKEQVLVYVFDEIQKSYEYRNIVQKVLQNIEYILLALNKTGESYNVIESMSHFYAVLCRSYQRIGQLRMFLLDAMYCLQLKAFVLVQQCLEVWMSILPLGHMGLAKCPLVICLVYLLHFYKCADKHTRVHEMRNMLNWTYSYDLNDSNENKTLDRFRSAIIELKDSSMDRKILRLSLLVLAKRQGAKWCQTHIVINMLQPLINDRSTSDITKRFCVSLLGPLLKPYPAHMKVHCETVIDYLMDMLHRKNSPEMQEAIVSSLMCVDRNNYRFYQFLAKWCPQQVSPEFSMAFKDYVRSKTMISWKQILSQRID